MEFKHEIILVYHKDNEMNTGNNGIWRENFAQTLSFALGKILNIVGQVPCFEMASETIQATLNSSKLIVLLVDDPFLESNVSDEILSDCAKNQASNQDMSMLKKRILPVIASSLPRDLFPLLIRDHIGYDFTSIRIREKMIKEKGGNYAHSKSISIFWLKTYDLVLDIRSRLAILDGEDEVKITKERTVYLAETSSDLIDIRDHIKRDLKRHGYAVLPDQLIPREISEIPSFVNRILSKTCLAIHLIGENYGELYVENKREKDHRSDDSLENKSITDIQNKLAEEYCARLNAQKGSKKYKRIIWINPEIELLNEKQKRFTENIKRNSEGKLESELLQSPIEDLKTFIRNSLNEKPMPDSEKLPVNGKIGQSNKKNVYLIFDRKDCDTSESVKNFLTKHGFNVLMPSFDGEYFELENLHKNNLKLCDACVVVAENASDQWLNTKLKDIDKIHGFGRIKPIKVKAVFFGNKDMNGSTFVKKNGTVVINHDGQLTEKIMEPFLNKFTISNGQKRGNNY